MVACRGCGFPPSRGARVAPVGVSGCGPRGSGGAGSRVGLRGRGRSARARWLCGTRGMSGTAGVWCCACVGVARVLGGSFGRCGVSLGRRGRWDFWVVCATLCVAVWGREAVPVWMFPSGAWDAWVWVGGDTPQGYRMAVLGGDMWGCTVWCIGERCVCVLFRSHCLCRGGRGGLRAGHACWWGWRGRPTVVPGKAAGARVCAFVEEWGVGDQVGRG